MEKMDVLDNLAPTHENVWVQIHHITGWMLVMTTREKKLRIDIARGIIYQINTVGARWSFRNHHCMETR
jgi:phage pi2 protein 07